MSKFGPGLLYAGAAIGVSHLVQSTRAGADFGFALVWAVLLVNIIKYPIFEIGPRYAAATGQTLLEGYRKLGKWALMLYVLMTLSTMFTIMAAISLVTSGLFYQLTGYGSDSKYIALLLLVISAIVLSIGKYSFLDRAMKPLIALLSICTLFALLLAATEPSHTHTEYLQQFSFSNRSHVIFLAALIGWMPAPIDLVIWHSVWSVSKIRNGRKKISIKDALLDFKFGYWITTILAVVFLSLGALMMYGTGLKPSESAVGFSKQLMLLYVRNIGDWSFPFIALAAFAAMFSTLITCLDAFPRTLRKSGKLLLPRLNNKIHHQSIYVYMMVLTIVGTAIVLFYFSSEMKSLVDFATTISFVLAPVLAILNFIVMERAKISKDEQQPAWLKFFTKLSIVLLIIMSIWYLLYQF